MPLERQRDVHFTAACIRVEKTLRRYRRVGNKPTHDALRVSKDISRASFRLDGFVRDRLTEDALQVVAQPDYRIARHQIIQDLRLHRSLSWHLKQCAATPLGTDSDLFDVTVAAIRKFRDVIDDTRGNRVPRRVKDRLRKQAQQQLLSALAGLNQVNIGVRNRKPNDHLVVGSALLRGTTPGAV